MEDSSEVLWYVAGEVSVQYWSNDMQKPGVNICRIKHCLIFLRIITDVFIWSCELSQCPV